MKNIRGEFTRPDSTFRFWINQESEIFKPDSGRYHIYISLACPWAHRTMIVANLKGLRDHITFSVVHPTWQRTKPESDEHCGWVFRNPEDPSVSSIQGFGSFDCEGCIPDYINQTKTVRELYEKCGGTTGRYSVPILWDKK